MATTNNLRKGLNRKLWEVCNIAPSTSSAGSCIISSRHHRNQQLYVATGSSAFLYLPEEDAYVSVPNPSLGGTFGIGTCGTCAAVGPTGTATGGSGIALNTNLTIQRDLRGYKIHITGGPAAGDVVEILSNTIGANSVISANFSATITAASTYRILTPRWYVNNGGTASASSFRVYCYALNTWTSLSVTGYHTSITTDMRAISTPSFIDGDFVSFATGTATSGTANTIVNTGKAWTVNQWSNYQVRITGGAGAGQVRTISSNTATAITVSANWSTNPDATSTYSIEGNDDFLYFTGNASTTFYRYSISGNSWTTLAARPSGLGNGIGGSWVWGSTDSAWTAENSIINGRRIYSFAGNSGAALHYYDIPSNSWTTVTYAPATEGFSSGTKYVYIGDFIYLTRDATGRWFRYSVVKSDMDGWGVVVIPQGTAVVGDTAFDWSYKDGATKITFIYFLLNSSSTMMRSLII